MTTRDAYLSEPRLQWCAEIQTMSTSYSIITTKYSIRKSTLKNINVRRATIFVFLCRLLKERGRCMFPFLLLSSLFRSLQKENSWTILYRNLSFLFLIGKKNTRKLKYEGQLKRGRIIESLYCHTPSLASGVSFIRYMILDTVTNALYLIVS